MTLKRINLTGNQFALIREQTSITTERISTASSKILLYLKRRQLYKLKTSNLILKNVKNRLPQQNNQLRFTYFWSLSCEVLIRDNLFSVASPNLVSPVVFIGLKLINICYLWGSSELNRKARVVSSGLDIKRKCRYSRCVAPRPFQFLQVGIPQFDCCAWNE